MQKIFEALASETRRKILAHLAHEELSASVIAARFDLSKPAVSRHLSVLENAGLVACEKRKQFVYYWLKPDIVSNALDAFMQEICPASKIIKD